MATADNINDIYILRKICKLLRLFDTLYEAYFFLYIEIKCIANHLNFESIVLLDENLYTALVEMYDWESSFLPLRNSVQMSKMIFYFISIKCYYMFYYTYK